MKIRPVGAELFHVDGQTWQSDSRFTQFCERARRRETEIILTIFIIIIIL